MTKNIFLLLAACSFLLTGCIETLEEIYLNKDGSGKYNVTFDMSEFFSNPMMKSMIEEAAKEEGGEGDLNLGETDTLIRFRDSGLMEGVMKNAEMRMTMSDSLGKFLISMNFPFENVSQIDEFFQRLSEEGAGAEAMGGMGAMGSMLMPGGKFAFQKKKLTRLKSEQGGAGELLAGEDGEFMKMFFSGGTHTVIYHLPGKVKKTTIEGAEVDGKTVTVERPLMDLMEGKAGLEGEIRFKNK